jgi:hypothetical protein
VVADAAQIIVGNVALRINGAMHHDASDGLIRFD